MADSSSLTQSQKDELMDQVKQQIAIANAQELLQEMTRKCFTKCVAKPGSVMDSNDQKCIAMCMDRYMDSWNLVSKAYGQRLEAERSKL